MSEQGPENPAQDRLSAILRVDALVAAVCLSGGAALVLLTVFEVLEGKFTAAAPLGTLGGVVLVTISVTGLVHLTQLELRAKR